MSHDHSHDIKNYNLSFAIGITLNIVFVAIEAGYGFAADSLALIADAGHNLSDVISLLLAWGGSYLASRPPTLFRTYGFRRVTILTSLVSAVFLLIALGGIATEDLGRFSRPETVNANIVIVVAAVGVVINAATAFLFFSGQKHDLNIRAAYLHMAADAGISLGVVIIGLAIMFTGWVWLDPVISLAIVLVILMGTWSLLKESINLSIDAVPEGIDMSGITDYLNNLEEVSEIHDLHVWALSTTETALTVHLVTNGVVNDNQLLQNVSQYLHDEYDIEHATIQIENGEFDNYCSLNCQH